MVEIALLGSLFFGWAGQRWNKLALLGGIYVINWMSPDAAETNVTAGNATHLLAPLSLGI